MATSTETAIADRYTIFREFNSLKNSIYEESKKCDILTPFLDEIQAALEANNYEKSLSLIDELEEFMDLEFLKVDR